MTTNDPFPATEFASPGYETAPGDWAPEDRNMLEEIRQLLPELEGWGHLPLGMAWGSYSEDVFLLSWLEADQHELTREGLWPFLAYIHYHAVHGQPRWGMTPEELLEFAETTEYLSHEKISDESYTSTMTNTGETAYEQ